MMSVRRRLRLPVHAGPGPAAATILVVEDEPTVCELAAEALLDEGYRVLTAADAWEAEAILAGRASTCSSPISTSPATRTASRWRGGRAGLCPELPVVYTSGGRACLSPADAVSESVFVPKPYRPSQLVTLTNDILRAASPPRLIPPPSHAMRPHPSAAPGLALALSAAASPRRRPPAT